METEKETVNEGTEIVVLRDGARNIRFHGEMIGEASSHSYQGPSSSRWTEISIYRTKAGAFIASIVGRTCWQGETDRHSAYLCANAAEVVEALERDNDGELSWVAKKALDNADIPAEQVVE